MLLIMSPNHNGKKIQSNITHICQFTMILTNEAKSSIAILILKIFKIKYETNDTSPPFLFDFDFAIEPHPYPSHYGNSIASGDALPACDIPKIIFLVAMLHPCLTRTGNKFCKPRMVKGKWIDIYMSSRME